MVYDFRVFSHEFQRVLLLSFITYSSLLAYEMRNVHRSNDYKLLQKVFCTYIETFDA